MLNTIFLTAAVVGGAVMVCQLVLSLLGLGEHGAAHGHFGHGDFSADHAGGHYGGHDADAGADGDMTGDDRLSVSIASPSGSFVAAAYACACCGLSWLPKKTSGLVQAATARRMCVVRNDKPTWYAAAQYDDVGKT